MEKKVYKQVLIIITINLVVIGAVFFLYTFLKGRQNTRENPFEYTEADVFKKTPQKLLTYRETESITLKGRSFLGMAVDDKGSIFVTTDNSLLEIDTGGSVSTVITLEGQTGPVAVDENNLYLAISGRIEIYSRSDYSLLHTSSLLSQDSLVTSLICAGNYLVAADARGKTAFLIDKAENPGRVVSTINGGFIIPGPHFDAVPGNTKDTFWLVNPGKHSLNLYNTAGKRLKSWEASSFAIEGFSGCCNPAHIGLTRDGLLVTAEKGIPRVKVYTAEGRFVGVVAGNEQFEQDEPIADLAVDRNGRVLILDSVKKAVRIFEKRKEISGE